MHVSSLFASLVYQDHALMVIQDETQKIFAYMFHERKRFHVAF